MFMTGQGDISMTVRAMKAGAVDFLAKPFRDQDMLEAAAAIDQDRTRRSESAWPGSFPRRVNLGPAPETSEAAAP